MSLTGERETVTTSEGDISEALSDALLQQALEEREELIAQYRSALLKADQEARLIRQLLSVRQAERHDDGPALLQTIASITSGEAPPPSRHPVVEDVARILESEGHPIHISEIVRLLEKEGATLPGRGDQANVIAHLRRDPRFVRPSRGVYGLASWGLKNTDVGDGVRRRTKKSVRRTDSRRVDE